MASNRGAKVFVEKRLTRCVGQLALSWIIGLGFMAAAGAQPNKSLRVLALGDSYTIGTGVNLDESYPMQLAQGLEEKGYAVSELEVVAQKGWATRNLLQELQSRKLPKNYDWVLLMIGVNDQYQYRSKFEFKRNFDQLLKLAKSYTEQSDGRVIVLTIPDWSVSPSASLNDRNFISSAIAEFNGIVVDKTRAAQQHLVILHSVIEKSRGKVDFFASDQLHFSGKMYALWAQRIEHKMLRIMDNGGLSPGYYLR